MQNDPAASKVKTSEYEIIFKRESYFSDAATQLIFLVITIVGFKYFIVYFLGSGVYTYVIGLIFAAVWILSIISLWQNYRTSIIVSDKGIAEKRLSGGGWSYKWSEISEWNDLIAGEDGDREIRFTTAGVTHT